MKPLFLLLACVWAQQLNLGWVYVTDDRGPDDEVAQGDVNYMGFNKDNELYAEVTWSWDDTLYPGKNSGDGCSLWDLNKNGNADFALCVRINSDASGVVTQTLTQLFDCRDTRNTACPIDGQPGFNDPTNHSRMISTEPSGPRLKSTCYINFMVDPFAGVASHSGEQNATHDTRAVCRLYYDELTEAGVIQPGDPQLLNVCTYPSSSPTSDEKDCVVTAGSGFLVINKWTNQASACSTYPAFGFACGGNLPEARCTLSNCSSAVRETWNFTYRSSTKTATTSVSGWGWSPLTILPAATYSVLENTPPAGWVQVGFRCVDNQTNPNSVVISSGQTLVCYYVNFLGNLSTFVQLYGNFSAGTSNITLDQYVPPRTFAPTASTPTPACPAAVDTYFRTCLDADFVGACGPTCLAAANSLQTAYVGTTVAFQDRCIGEFNTAAGLILSVSTMNTISSRINAVPEKPLCTNGNAVVTLAPSIQSAQQNSGCPAVASFAFLGLLFLFH
jgi:hypothetical protein